MSFSLFSPLLYLLFCLGQGQGEEEGREEKRERERQGGHAPGRERSSPLLSCFFCILHFEGRDGRVGGFHRFLTRLPVFGLFKASHISGVEWPTNSFLLLPSQFSIDSEEDWYRQKETSQSNRPHK